MGANPAPPAPPAASLAERTLALWQQPELLLGRLALIIIILIAAGLLYMVVRRVLGRLQRQLVDRSTTGPEAARRRLYRSLTIVGLLSSIAKWAIFLTAILSVLSLGGMNLWPVLTGAGIAGVAIGLGAQSLIRDFLSGFFIILEGQFAVGDHVAIGTLFGVVEEVGLRITVLRDLGGQLHYIPNGTIVNVTVYEQPRRDYALHLELPVAAQAQQAAETLKGLLQDATADFSPYLISFSNPETRPLTGNLQSVQATVSVFPNQEWLATEELPARWMRRLKAAGLELPDGLKPRTYQTKR
ncbi:MAG: mechanosensitive ion channel family protein [Armatimonadota bacterium]